MNVLGLLVFPVLHAAAEAAAAAAAEAAAAAAAAVVAAACANIQVLTVRGKTSLVTHSGDHGERNSF